MRNIWRNYLADRREVGDLVTFHPFEIIAFFVVYTIISVIIVATR